MTHSDIDLYLKKVKRCYRGSIRNKRSFLDELTDALEQYAKENPDSTMDDLIREFGSPNDVKESFLDAYSDTIHKRNYILMIALLAVVLCLCIPLCRTLYQRIKFRNGYFTSTLRVWDTEEVPESELFYEDPSDPEPIEIIR